MDNKEKVELGEEQKKVFDFLEWSMKSCFIHGKAGVGKSELIRYFIENTTKDVIVVGYTGVAALNIGGRTLHSFFQLPLGFQNTTDDDIKSISKKNRDIIKNADTLIIDEVSMVCPDILEIINLKCQYIRKSFLPFGGLQLILVGDLFQIPPVIDKKLYHCYDDIYKGTMFYNSPTIKSLELNIFELEHIYRQENRDFIGILNNIRVGKIDKTTLDKINTRVLTPPKDTIYITLATTNDIVDKINDTKLAEIESKEYIYNAVITGKMNENSYPTSSELRLKVGAQIMMVKNDPKYRWYNGSLGIITELSENYIKVRLDSGEYSIGTVEWKNYDFVYNEENRIIEREEIGKFEQFPVKIAWAVTIHKSQGKTFDNVLIDFGIGAFDYGQVYVALSRCRSLDGIYLKKPLKRSDIKVNQDVIEYIKNADVMKANDIVESLY